MRVGERASAPAHKKDYRCGASVRSGNKSDCVFERADKLRRYYTGVSVYQLRDWRSRLCEAGALSRALEARTSFWKIWFSQPPTRPRSISSIIAVSRFQVPRMMIAPPFLQEGASRSSILHPRVQSGSDRRMSADAERVNERTGI